MDDQEPQPHPYLHDPLLYISNLPAYVSDENLAVAFVSCGPHRPRIPRDTDSPLVSGTIEFKYLDQAEKALATLQSRPIPGLIPIVTLVLSPYPPTNPPTPLPPPSAQPRLVKHLPAGYSDSQLYDIFRPYGALASVRTHTHFGPDTGVVEYYNEDEAKIAEEAMHCADVDGQNIAVQVYQPRRTSGTLADFSPTAPAFVPSGSVYSPYGQYSPPRASPYNPRSSLPPAAFVHGPGQQVQLAPLSGPGANSHSGLIDPCNLFCKNLDPEIDSNGLFTHFRQFGQIVSARVMRNENGESRGFGFVSFQTPDQAMAAMHAMNGITLGSKQITVRLHEPKQLRQEKLAARFGAHNGHPRNSSGATSPTISEGGESYGGWGSPRHHSVSLGSPVGSIYDRPERGRRGSGSYYNAALAGTLNISMRYDDLSSLSPVVRKEVLTGELSRRIKTMDIVPSDDIDTIVDSLVNISLSEIVQSIEDPEKLAHKVKDLEKRIRPGGQRNDSPSPAGSNSRSASASQDSRLLDPKSLEATASAPEHPSTPISMTNSLSTPPRTSSPSGSVPPTTERDRIMSAISKLESDSDKTSELTELIMSLSKRERAMCLFNVEHLRAKLADAKLVLESSEETEATPVQPTPPKTTTTTTMTTKPTPPTTTTTTTTGTQPLSTLVHLPAAEITRLLFSSPQTYGLNPPDPQIKSTTDTFIDSLLSKPPQQQKQALGEKLFKIVKGFGAGRNAPKVTVALLDQEDLRALAHLMNCFPEVLREKVVSVSVTK